VRRKLILTLYALAILVVAAVVLLTLAQRIDPNEYRVPLTDAISDSSGLDWQIEGELELKLGLFPAITAHHLVVRNPDPRWTRAIGRVDRVELRVNLWKALVLREVEVRKAEVTGVAVSLRVDEEGRANWRGRAPVDSDDAGIALSILRAEVRDVSVHFAHDQAGDAVSLTLDEMVFAPGSSGDLFSLNLEGQLDDEHFSIEAELERDLIAKLSRGERSRVAAKAVFPDAQLTVVGRGGGEALHRGAELEVTGRAETLAPIARWLELPEGLDGRAVGPVEVTARIRSDMGEVHVEDLKLVVGSAETSHFRVTGSISDLLDRRTMDLDVQVALRSLDALLERAKLAPIGVDAAEASARIVGRAGTLEARSLTARLEHHAGAIANFEGSLSLAGKVLGGELDVGLEAARAEQILEIFERWMPPVGAQAEPPEWRRAWDHRVLRALGPVAATGKLSGTLDDMRLTHLDAKVGTRGGDWIRARGEVVRLLEGEGVSLDMEVGTASLESLLDEAGLDTLPLDRVDARGLLNDQQGYLALQGIEVTAYRGDGLRITASGDLPRLDSRSIQGWQVKVYGSRPGALSELLGLPVRDWGSPIQASARVDASEREIAIRDLSLELSESRLTGFVTLVLDRSPRPFIDVDLSSERLRLRDLGIKPDDRAEEDAPSRWLSSDPLPFDALTRFDAHLRLKFGQLVGRGEFRVGKVGLNIRLQDGVVEGDGLHMRWQGGEVRASVRLDSSQRPARHFVKLVVRGAVLEQLLAQRTLEKVATGDLEISADLYSSGDSGRSILEGVGGDLFFHVSHGMVATKYSKAMRIDVLHEINPNYDAPQIDTLNCLIADFAVDAGRFDIRSLLLDTPNTQILASGHIDLSEWVLKVVLTPVFKGKSLGSIAAAVNVHGSIDDPKIMVEPFATASAATRGAVKRAMSPVDRYLPGVAKTIENVRRSTSRAAEEWTGADRLWEPGKDMSCELILESERIKAARALEVDLAKTLRRADL
jgi:uncharacterized protein involved in outer membrane biogenesis